MPILRVGGMRCAHCQKAVTEAVEAIAGAIQVQVNLEEGTVSWENNAGACVPEGAVQEAIRAIGFEVL